MILASFGDLALEPYDHAWFIVDCSYGLNYSGPPAALAEVYDPNPNWRARFQSVYFGKMHLVLATWDPILMSARTV